MQQITLTDEQLNAFSQVHDPVAVRDVQGRLRGYMAIVVGGDEIADAKRALASHEPRYTTTEVLAHLRARGTP
jgi:hypothetical protein